jgi:2-polyprenyl-3-methyl-5-hydroxy-6-metoxy-1,4-benzoquinol methylase
MVVKSPFGGEIVHNHRRATGARPNETDESSKMNDDAKIVSDYWGVDRKASRPKNWLEHQVMYEFLHRRVSGDANVATCGWFKQQFFPEPVELCLSLGCGFGGFERGAIAAGISNRFHANDLSSGAIEKAQQAARDAGLADRIKYSVVNLDKIALSPQTYDAIFAISSAHHILELENLFKQCRIALKPGSLLFLDEYVGPSRFQTPPFVNDTINRILAILPARYRRNLFADDGSTIDRYVPPTIEQMKGLDPSEAIRSADIMTALKLYFDIVEFRPYGGGILHMLFSGIMGNFDENNDSDVALLKTIATFEEILEETGAIQSDFAVIVAKPRETAAEKRSWTMPFRKIKSSR